MKSNTVIGTLCWITIILHWTTDLFPGGLLPLALCLSWVIMRFFGFFKREKGIAAFDKAVDEENNLSERQREFRRKMKEGQQDDDLSATIKVLDEYGAESSVIINENGDVSTTGNPHPDIVTAARMLRESVIKHGPEAIARELGKQIAKISKGNNSEK